MKHCILAILLMAVGIHADDPLDVSRKEVFTKGYPQLLAFRGEMSRVSRSSYDAWCASVRGASGVIRKFMPEELPKIYPESAAWADRYVQEHPEQLMMLHLNGESRQVMDNPAVHQRYFPGHWVYEPGSELVRSIGPEDTEITVRDASPFNAEAYLDRHRRDGEKFWFHQHVILVPLDENGHRLWTESEYAIVQRVDRERNVLTVERGQIFSTARSFKAGRTAVAPLAAGVWGGAPMWYYNLSSTCPRDRNGRAAADVFLNEITEWFSSFGPLSHFNGIAFDVNYWKVRDPKWDTDGDGTADAGLIDGTNVWREGDWTFLKQLRQALGDDLLITCDGQHPQNQQAVGVLDGIESEGLVQHNDGFRGFSRTINTHLYWRQNNTRQHDFRYIVLKLMDPNDEARGDQLRRFATAIACCLEAFVTGRSAPFLPDGFSTPGSLGFPSGPLLRPAQDTPDLLEGKGLDHLWGEDCTLQQKDGALLITPDTSGNPLTPMTVTLKDLKVPAGDLTLFVTMEAVDPLNGFSADDRVPRLVQAEFSKVPDYGEGPRVNEFYSDLYGYIGTHEPSVLSFYLRRPGCGVEQMDVTFRIEGRGRAAVHAVTAHGFPDVLVREFEHGIVAVNPALEPVTVSVPDLLPEPLEIPALDALFLPR